MELKTEHEDEKSFSILKGDESCISRILAREASKGQSSRIFYRSAEGVPFKWETNPGTPKNPQQEDQIFPLCPSPLMQSLGLPLPNVDVDDHDHETKGSGLKTAIISGFRKMVKKNIISDVSKWKSKKRDGSTFGDSNGELVGSVKGSSFSSNSSFSMFSSNGCVVDTGTIEGPFCCNPLDVHAMLDGGNTKIYYCSHHKTAFAVEQDNKILSHEVSSLENEQSPAGIPFRWEMQPGTPKHQSENELIITPPSPPPAVQSLALRRHMQHDRSVWKRAGFWSLKKKGAQNVKNGNSIRCHENTDDCGLEFEASLRRSTSVSSLKMGGKVNESYLISCNPWRRRDVLVFAKRKLKSFIS